MSSSLQYLSPSKRFETEKTDPFDLVTLDPDENEYVLHLVEDLKPGLSQEQVLQIQDRFLEYVGYVISGDVTRDFPDFPTRSFRFQLDCFDHPRGKAIQLIEETANQLQAFGISFRVKVID